MSIDYAEQTIKLAKEMKLLMTHKEDLASATSECQKRLDQIRMTELPEAMEAAGVEKLTIAGVGTVYLRSDLWASIPADTKGEAWAWLTDNGFGDLITTTINSSTLRAWAKEQLQGGEQLPEGLFKITPYSMAVITK